MTFHSLSVGDRGLTLRYYPALAWLFIGLVLYGVGTILVAVQAGIQPLTAGTIFAIAALLAMVLFVAATAGQYVVCSFERSSNLMRICHYGLLGRRTIERPLSEVTRLNVRILRRAQHRVELQMRSGEQIPLTPYYVVTFGTSVITRLGRLLGLEPNVIEAPRR